MNLLIPSIGRKYLLAKAFREALAHRRGKLFAADLTGRAAGLHAADEPLRLPPCEAPGFWTALDEVVRTRRIDAVVPVRDAELPLWAARAEAGRSSADIVISPLRTVELCLDKWRLYEHAVAAGIPCPDTRRWWPGDPTGDPLAFPLVVKPRRGAGSRGVRIVQSADELPGSKPTVAREEVLLQELVEGPEYTVDAYAGACGDLVATVTRRRRTVRAGQMDIGETVHDPELAELCRRLATTLTFRGAINLQFIRGPAGPRLIDVNPRFSGGFALTRAAGMDFAEWTVRELRGEPLEIPQTYEELTHLGYSAGVVVPTEALSTL